MTKREFLNMVIEDVDNDEMVEFAKDEIKKLDARNAKRASTMTATQKENAEIKKKIAEFFSAEGGWFTAREVGEEMNISTQRASALLRQMVEAGDATVKDIKVKGKGKQKAYTANVTE